MPKKQKPDAAWYTVRIPRSDVPFLQERCTEMGISQARYVQNLIEADRRNIGQDLMLYRLSNSEAPVSVATKTPTPHLRKKKSGV
jgi:hypothetical protein